jgi:hypothetical protein
VNLISPRVVEHVHGHMGWLASLALVHPAILLRRTKRRALFATAAATVLVTLTAVMGAAMYPEYRTAIKPALFAEAPSLGWAFERKEHLATAAVLLAWAGLFAHLAAHRPNGRNEAERLARLAHGAYVAAAFSALLAASLGIAVACQRSFL